MILDSDEEMILPNPSLSQSLTLGNLSGSSCPSPVAMDTSRHSVIADNRDMFSTGAHTHWSVLNLSRYRVIFTE